jgi:hypothetical protein
MYLNIIYIQIHSKIEKLNLEWREHVRGQFFYFILSSISMHVFIGLLELELMLACGNIHSLYVAG